ncbi:hypothetical protein [Amycolatopsis sp. lyj-108]|uniref:hypothetical protein n=1 Tax=Amycolatopsis sp. lyj-108 TaxID=2789286 RepID=UPI0039783834
MTAYHEIYLRPLGERFDVVVDLERILCVRFDRTPWNGFVAGASIDGEVAIEVDDDMRLENDGDIPFEDHPWMIVVRNFSRDHVAERQLADRIYQGLCETGRYSLFLTLDGGRMIESAIRDDPHLPD